MYSYHLNRSHRLYSTCGMSHRLLYTQTYTAGVDARREPVSVILIIRCLRRTSSKWRVATAKYSITTSWPPDGHVNFISGIRCADCYRSSVCPCADCACSGVYRDCSIRSDTASECKLTGQLTTCSKEYNKRSLNIGCKRSTNPCCWCHQQTATAEILTWQMQHIPANQAVWLVHSHSYVICTGKFEAAVTLIT